MNILNLIDWAVLAAVGPTFLISAIAFTIIIYWWRATRGTWKDYPAGRSLMGLLGIIAVGFGWGFLSRIVGDYPGRNVIAVLMYLTFISALVYIGITIRREMRYGKQRLNSKEPTMSGPVTVIVAAKNEENSDVDRTH
jgi:hypothetical protein